MNSHPDDDDSLEADAEWLQKLGRRHDPSITPDERAAMEANGDPDEDWCFLSLPPPGEGHNSGLKRIADLLQRRFELSRKEAFDQIRSQYDRARPDSDIYRALDRAGKPSSAKLGKKFPPADPRLTAAAIAATEGSVGELNVLSPADPNAPPGEVLRVLMRARPGEDPLVCVGAAAKVFNTLPLSEVAPYLVDRPYFVPQPMTARKGMTIDDPHLSHKCDANTTQERLNVVVESDKLSKDDQAAVIMFLSHFVPLTVVCDSGGKSLHAFFNIAERPLQEQEAFMRIACQLGADPRMWGLSQFARIPGGLRPAVAAEGDKPGKPAQRQSIVYYDPEAATATDGWRIDELIKWAAEITREAEHPRADHTLVRGFMSFPTNPPAEDVLAGIAWLRICDIHFLNSSAGAGKSVAMIQGTIAWGLGLPWLGIAPTRPLRILHFVGEDDESTLGQCREGFLQHAQATVGRTVEPAELQKLDAMVRTDFSRQYTGNGFLVRLEEMLTEEPADVVFINPLLSFIGGEIVANASMFLRDGIMPIMQKHRTACIIAHHTCKLSKASWDDMDFTYSGIGGGEVANVPRSILTLAPTKVKGLNILHVSKRPTTGWTDDDGRFTDHIYLRRTDNPARPAWLPVSHEEAESSRDGEKTAKAGGRKVCVQDIVEAVKEAPMDRPRLLAKLQSEKHCSIKPAQEALRDARALGVVCTFEQANPRGGKAILWVSKPGSESQGVA